MWDNIGSAVGHWLQSLNEKLGLGEGVLTIRLLYHWPAPHSSNRILCWLFDGLQDVMAIICKPSRTGERKDKPKQPGITHEP